MLPVACAGASQCCCPVMSQAAEGEVAKACLRKEAKFSALMQGHPCIVRVHGHADLDGNYSLVLELADGGDLHTRIFHRFAHIQLSLLRSLLCAFNVQGRRAGQSPATCWHRLGYTTGGEQGS